MTSKEIVTIAFVAVLGAGSLCPGEETETSEPPNQSLLQCETLTNNWFSLGEQLGERGICVGLGLTQIYQINLDGGLATHRHSGRYTGSYDLEAEFDLEKLINLKGGLIFLHAEGSWSDGLDASSIGSLFGINGDAGGDRSIDLTEYYYEQALLDDKVKFRVGKLDLAGGFTCRGCPVAFDGNAFANDETAQFLNGALVNNPTIPMPDLGLGAVLYLNPIGWWYFSAGVGDAQADAREAGFNTAFHDEDYSFSIFETGVTPQLPSGNGPLQGAYRVGFWYDPQDKDKHDGGVKRDDMGFKAWACSPATAGPTKMSVRSSASGASGPNTRASFPPATTICWGSESPRAYWSVMQVSQQTTRRRWSSTTTRPSHRG